MKPIIRYSFPLIIHHTVMLTIIERDDGKQKQTLEDRAQESPLRG